MLIACLATSHEALDLFASAQRYTPPGLRVAVTGFSNSLLRTFLKNAEGSPVDGEFLSVGTAGTLNPTIAPGTIFLPERVHSPAKPPLAPDPALLGRIKAALARAGLSFAEGTLLTQEGMVGSQRMREAVFREGYDAADKEGYGFLEEFARRGRPAAALRVIAHRSDERARWDYERGLEELSRRLSRALFEVLPATRA